jgi:hypothetical protein
MKIHLSKLVSTLALLALLAPLAHAQLQKQMLAPNSVGLVVSTTNSYSGKGDLKGPDGTYQDIRSRSFSFQASQTFYLAETDAATINLEYHHNDLLGCDKVERPVPLPNELRSLGGSFEYSHEFNKTWSSAAGIGLFNNVAGDRLVHKGWGTTIYAVAIRNKDPNHQCYYGLAYDSLSRDWKVVPVFGIQWTPSPGWTISLGVPKTAVSYSLRSNLTLSFELSGEGGTYYVEKNRHPSAATHSLDNTRMEYSEVRLGFAAAWRINNRAAIMGSIGTAAYREFKYLEADDKSYRLRSQTASPYVSLTLCTAF